MQFINPVFLWGLLFLAIPIIIHLFQFRRFKKVYFSNTPFLREIKETSQQSRKLKHLLVLLMRLLAIAFLVFAFAQPIIPKGEKVVTGTRGVSVYVDNSFSMSSMGRDINLLENARRTAREIINSYGESDEFQILSGDFQNRQQRLYNREQALDLLDDIQASPVVRTLDEIIQRQKHALRNYDPERSSSYIISDFQKNISVFEEQTDSLFTINLVHLESVEAKNVSVDSVWFSQPVQVVNQSGYLLLQLTNHDLSNSEEVNLELRLGDQRRPAGRISLEPGETITDTVSFNINRIGWQRATLSITDFPIQFDDDYHISFHVRDKIRVLTIHSGLGSNKYLSALFNGIPYMEEDLMRVTNINYGSFSNYNLIILNELDQMSSGFSREVENYLEGGGNVMIFPAADEGASVLNGFNERLNIGQMGTWSESEFQVGDINLEDPIFTGVFDRLQGELNLPKVNGRYALPRGGQYIGVPLLRFRDNAPFVSKYNYKNGAIFYVASPLDLDYNNLVSNGEVFVPLLYRAAIASRQRDRISYFLGQDQLIPMRNIDPERQSNFRIEGKEEFLPAVESRGSNLFLNVYDQIREPGFYEIYQQDDLRKLVAFNYDRRESRIAAYSAEELNEISGSNFEIIAMGPKLSNGTFFSRARLGNELWQWCLIVVLLALLAEQLILRFWKVGKVERS